MNKPQQIAICKKIISLFSVIRIYNIFLLIVAQYLTAIFVFSPHRKKLQAIFDVSLLYIVLASVCIIAAGYIINNFYDLKMDRINKPVKYGLDSYVKESTKLFLYFTLNFIGFFFALLVSWWVVLFFSSFIFWHLVLFAQT